MSKRTKIVATISDFRCDVDFLQKLFDEGMNVVRINTAHATFEGATKIIENVRKVSDKIAILIDTKGPEIRTLPIEEDLSVAYGDKIKIAGLKKEETPNKDIVYVNYPHFVSDVPEQSKILIDDGALELIVHSKTDTYLDCEVMNTGKIQGKKSINIPSAHIKLPALSKKDMDFIQFAVEQKVDFIAHSFVRNKEDIIAVQTILDALSSDIKIIAKIENKQGVDNIEEILDHAYGVMIARGDLAIEISPEKLPAIQKQLASIAIERRRPVIVATQMLHTMIEHPRPTRAEVNDIANAVYDRVDAIMLSGETAYGQYPVESVQMMKKIVKEVEAHDNTFKTKVNAKAVFQRFLEEFPSQNIRVAAELSKQAIKISDELDIKAIVADTTSGRTIRNLSAYRGSKTIFAQCYCKKTMRWLALSYGVYVDYIEEAKDHSSFIKKSLNNLIYKKAFNKDNLVLIIAGNFGRSTGVSYMEVATVNNLLE